MTLRSQGLQTAQPTPDGHDRYRKFAITCPVRIQCLDYALSGADTWGGITAGIWAGTTPQERARLRRQRKAAAA